jgi:hypothetical protein
MFASSKRISRSDKSQSSRPMLEDLEGRTMMTTTSQVAAAALLRTFTNQVATIARYRGGALTANDLTAATRNTLLTAMGRGGLNWVANLTPNQGYYFVMNSGLGQVGLRRDPVTGFNPVTDLGPGFTYGVYQYVVNDIARNFSRGATNIDYLGVMRKYGLMNVQGAQWSGLGAYLNLGIVQNGTSFLARLPNGQQAYPKDFGLPYTNSGVFNPGAINYNNVYNNAWNYNSGWRF